MIGLRPTDVHEDAKQSSSQLPSVELQEDVPTPVVAGGPPDGGYGWVVAGAVSTLNCFTWGVAATYGVYLAYYLTSKEFPEATSLDYAFIGSLNFSVAMAIAPPATILTRKFGKRPVMITGVFAQAGGFVAASFAKRIWQLYLSQGALIGLGIGLMFIPSTAVLSQWFEKKRSLAQGIASAGSGIGGLIFGFATQPMITNISLGWALRITGIVVFVTNM
ncbi:hypothetical protein B0A49_13775, partial [Cryomyces minteri]